MTKIEETYLIKDSPKNTGLLSKTHSANQKHGLNPLFTILNKDFNKQLKLDYGKQQSTGKQIITEDYIKEKQPDIIRLYNEYYPEDPIKKLNEQLTDKDGARLDFFHIGLDTTTRSIPISFDDIDEYLKRGGYNHYVFSLEARPNIIVFDFDIKVTPEDIEKLQQALRKYLYLIEYKESNGHIHVYLNGTDKDTLDYSNSPDHNNTLLTQDKEVVKIDVFKGAKRVVGCATTNNGYEIIYNEKPSKTIGLKQAIKLLAKSLGYTVNNRFLEELLNPTTKKILTTTNSNNNDYDKTPITPEDRPTRPTPEDNKRVIIENARPIFNELAHKGIRETLYRALTGALIRHEYTETTIRDIINEIQRYTDDKDNRQASANSCIHGYYKGDHIYGWTKFNELVTGATNKKSILNNLKQIQNMIFSHDKTKIDFMSITKKLQATLDEIHTIDDAFTEFFIKCLSDILRLNHINNDIIEELIPPTKYNYDLFGDISKEINENTFILNIVKLYVYTFNRKLSDKRIKPTTKEKITKQKQAFTDNMETIKELIINGSNQSLNETETPQGVQEIIDDILNDPYTIEERIQHLIKSGYNKLSTKYYQQQLMKLFKQKYELFIVDGRTRNGKYESKYYYVPTEYKDDIMTEENKIQKPYKEINRQWLLDEINEEINKIGLGFTTNDVFITLNDCQRMLEYVNNSKRFNKQYVELENIFVHKPTMKIIPKPYDIVTLDRLGMIQNEDTKDETIKLFKYDPHITLDTLTPDNITPTLEIIKQILVPRQDPNNQKILLFFLQLIGLMVHGNNDVKILPVFYREGNNGKGILSNILKLIFGDQGASDIKQDRIDDNFINEVVDGTNHVIINDELETDTISKNLSTYKQLSGASGMGGRQIFSNETRNTKEIPPLFLASNYIPEIEITAGNKAIIKRLVLIRMPNVFVDSEEIDNTRNEYEEKTGIDTIISNDYEGLSQLISISINEFKKLDYTTNVRSQMAITPTIQETMYKLSSDNPLINFIGAYTKPLIQDTPKHEWITTSMIKEAFIEWYKRNNKGLEPPIDLFGNNNTRIGGALETIYGKGNVIKDKLHNEPTKYCYKLLTDHDKEIINKELIVVHELDRSNKYHAEISNDTEIVYNIIKGANLTNEYEITQHLQQMGYKQKDIMDYLIELDRVDLIEYKEQTTL